MGSVLFSIIVVSFNEEKNIVSTIDSILKQKCEDYEIIVKDAMSKDNTIKVIPPSNKIRIVESSDMGIYDGMNQAIDLSSGEYVSFMNCGDIFFDDDVLDIMKKAIMSSGKRNVIYYTNYVRNGIVFRSPKTLSDFHLYKSPLNHQSMFISRNLFSQFGLYDTRYRILADYHFTLKVYRSSKNNLEYIDITSCKYLGGGFSESTDNKKLKKQEYDTIRAEYFTNKQRKKFDIWLFFSLRALRQKIISDSSPKIIRRIYRFIVNQFNKLG